MKKLSALFFAMLIIFSACSKPPEPVLPEQEITEETPIEEYEPPQPIVVFPTVYTYVPSEAEVDSAVWLDGSTVFWEEVKDGHCDFHTFNVETGEEKTVYSFEYEEDKYPYIEIKNSRIYLTYSDYPDREIVVLDKNTFEVIGGPYAFKDCPSAFDVSDKGIVYSAPCQYTNEVSLFPIDDSQNIQVLKLDPVPRYSNGAGVWSVTGEYFMLNNFDACGYDKYSCHMDVLGGIEDGCPTETQYDIFKADGSYVSSFVVDYANGSYHYYIEWIKDDKIFIENIYYGENSDGNDATTVYKVIDLEGNILMEAETFGESPSFNMFAEEGVYGIIRIYEEGTLNDDVYLYYLSFETGEITKLGCIANQGMENIRVSPNGKYATVVNVSLRNGFKVLKLE